MKLPENLYYIFFILVILTCVGILGAMVFDIHPGNDGAIGSAVSTLAITIYFMVNSRQHFRALTLKRIAKQYKDGKSQHSETIKQLQSLHNHAMNYLNSGFSSDTEKKTKQQITDYQINLNKLKSFIAKEKRYKLQYLASHFDYLVNNVLNNDPEHVNVYIKNLEQEQEIPEPDFKVIAKIDELHEHSNEPKQLIKITQAIDNLILHSLLTDLQQYTDQRFKDAD